MFSPLVYKITNIVIFIVTSFSILTYALGFNEKGYDSKYDNRCGLYQPRNYKIVYIHA
ncbi:hypothetical protein BDF21DRAFT_414162 [Thamnidium elegans]|nr:hypothetical protein BDF21DRAFT_414162 [Thamnidium elegans]